tara:strand:+ start:419 stop:1045 length:627 start_codon:yes stop_codon:yes gene_type:complete
MKVEVLNIKGKKTTKTINLDDNIFSITPNDHAMYLDVKSIMANNRQGTHKSKERGEITGSRKKIKKQKGTGTARAGDIKNPLFKGGGRVFGPRPRNYTNKLNKKLKQLARKSALTYKAKDNRIKVIESFDFKTPKTKQMVDIMLSLGLKESKTLIVLSEKNDNIMLSSKNIKNLQLLEAKNLNTYDILNYKDLVFVDKSVEQIEKILL